MRDKRTDNRVTLRDIAEETGYSINTVSHALRGLSDISPATREQIQAVAQRMGYMGNQIASSLRSGRTHTLAVILGGLANPFYGAFADKLQTAAQEKGYSLIIMCSREDPSLEQALVENAIARRADGLLLFPTNSSAGTVERLRALRFPYVLLSRALGEDLDDCVISDEEAGGYLGVQHLIEHGADNLGYIARRSVVFSYAARLRGFQRACDDFCLTPERQHTHICITENGNDTDEAFRASAIRTMLHWRCEGVNGLFAFNDIEAWQLESMISETPELSDWKVGLVGFDNIQSSQFFPCPLCSISADYGAMAEKAIDLLRDRIHGDTHPPKTIVCPVHLEHRGSCLD